MTLVRNSAFQVQANRTTASRALASATTSAVDSGKATALLFHLVPLYLLSSLLAPPSLYSLLALQTPLLIIMLFLTARLLTNSSTSLALPYAAALAISALVVFLLLGTYSPPPVPFATYTNGAALKEFARLLQLFSLFLVSYCYAHILYTMPVRGQIRAARLLALLLLIHVTIGILQFLQVDWVVSVLDTHYLRGDVQSHALTPNAVAVGNFRATGTVLNPNIYADIVLALFVSVISITKRLTVVLPVTLLAAIGLLLAQSRAAVVAFALVLFASLMIFRSLRRPILLIPLSLALVSLLLMGSLQFSRLERLLDFTITDLFISRPQYGIFLDVPAHLWALGGLGARAEILLPIDSDILFILLRFGVPGLSLIMLFAFLAGYVARVPSWWLSVFLSITAVSFTNTMLFGNETMPFTVLALVISILPSQSASKRSSMIRSSP